MIGRTLAHYRIVEKLGQGGMGVVYRAEDTRLGRSVAVKALFPQFTRDPRHRLRFEQEARAAAQLGHPGIATVYALEKLDDELFIVFEYVHGETLRAALQRGALPIDELLHVAISIARALEAAHAAGVVHRDLKPENIIRTEQGSVKILDFGLARLVAAATSQTAATRLTEAGLILGTVAYMSPEQLEARDVDFRGDIFSFGVMLYEMAAGIHPFEGSTSASTIAHVLNDEPTALSQRNSLTPPELDRIVRKCLRKRPEERYQSTSDLVVDLEQLGASFRRGADPAPASGRSAATLFQRNALFTPRWWWEFHQVWTILWQLPFVYAAWLARDKLGGGRGLAFFFAVLVLALITGNLRGHLLFTASFNANAVAAEVRRVAAWIKWIELAYMIVLLIGAWSISTSGTGLAVILVGMGIGLAIASVVFEPATTRAAFPSAIVDPRSKTPSRPRRASGRASGKARRRSSKRGPE